MSKVKLRWLITRFQSALNRIVALGGRTRVGRYVYGRVIANAMNRVKRVRHGGVELVFTVPNALTEFRADTFSTKEPETLAWLDAVPPSSVVWDIGANVGLYSCYAAKARRCRVFAFEPSVFNLELLARNIYLNGLSNEVVIIPLALSRHVEIAKLNMTTTEWGGALSTFGEEYGSDGSPLTKTFEFSTVGVSMAEAMTIFGIPRPDYVKLDVDGIEHLILSGSGDILQTVKGILVEIDDEFAAQADATREILNAAGLRLVEKRHAPCFDSGQWMHTFNQIWAR